MQCFLPSNYDRRVRPSHGIGSTLEIELNMLIESFGNVDVAKMEFHTFGYLSQKWTDKRLARVNETPLMLQDKDASLIWLPDIYCINCRESNLDNGRNEKQGMVKIDKEGQVYFSFLFVGIATCKMDLHEFPFDSQECSIELSSYGYNTSHVSYKWSKDPFVKIKSMDQFTLMNEKSSSRTEKYLLGNFTISEAKFTFKRRVGFYILQLYIPSAMLVCLSWTMFCLNRVHSGERITIGVTLFLTMIFLNGYANTSLPKVSYVKSVDLFMVVSLAEILLIIIESIVVTMLLVQKDNMLVRELSRKRTRNMSRTAWDDGHQEIKENLFQDNAEESCKVAMKAESLSDKVEVAQSQIPKTVRRKLVAKLIGAVDASKNSSKCCDGKVVIEKISVVLLPASYVAFNAWYWQQFIF
eukprot:gene1084-15417_t